MPTVRVDDEVYEWLQSLAVPFQDTPNSVLRRVAGLDETPLTQKGNLLDKTINADEIGVEEIVPIRATGKELSKIFQIEGEQSLYSDTGTFYGNLTKFPGVLWDRHGYVRFLSESDYRTSPYLQIGKRLNVPNGGIASIPGYTRVR
ncbi:MAG: hypothetical protein OXI91_04680 [Chloroflexota bacterium]|nr:hypothetical protein [Chloroflexota bacterium]